MALPWMDVLKNPAFQSLDDDQKEQARREYFDDVVASQIRPEEVDVARAEFDTDTGPIRTSAPDYFKAPLAGGLKAAGYGVRGIGQFTHDIGEKLRTTTNDVLGTDFQPEEDMLRGAGDYLTGLGNKVEQSYSPGAKAAIAGFNPTGNVFKPEGEFSFGDNVTPQGVGLRMLDTFGQIAPIAATALVTRGGGMVGQMGKSAGVAAAMGGGAASVEEGDRIRQMKNDPAKLSSVPAYRALREEGVDHESAVEDVARIAESGAFWHTAPVSALTGVLVGGVLSNAGQRALSKIVGTGTTARILGGAAISAPLEGAQEVAELSAQQYGASQATGEPREIGEGSFGEGLMGAMGGAGTAALGGALPVRGGLKKNEPMDLLQPETTFPDLPGEEPGASQAPDSRFVFEDEQQDIEPDIPAERPINPAMGDAFRKAQEVVVPQENQDFLQDRRTELREPDRRVDTATRKTVAEMTPDEMRQALHTDELTGLKNRRAFNDNSQKPIKAAVDVDSLKYVNDNMGHGSGDTLLRTLSQAFKDEGVEAYRFGGDEFVVQHYDEAMLDSQMSRVLERLKNATIEYTAPDGTKTVKTGIGFSYGKGPDLQIADEQLAVAKSTREKQGLRAPRGGIPGGVVKTPATGRQAEDNIAAPQEVTPQHAMPDGSVMPGATHPEGQILASEKQVAPQVSGVDPVIADALGKYSQSKEKFHGYLRGRLGKTKFAQRAQEIEQAWAGSKQADLARVDTVTPPPEMARAAIQEESGEKDTWKKTVYNMVDRGVFREIVSKSIQRDGQALLDAADNGNIVKLVDLQNKYAIDAGRLQGGGGAGPGKVKQSRRGGSDIFYGSVMAIKGITKDRLAAQAPRAAIDENVKPVEQKGKAQEFGDQPSKFILRGDYWNYSGDRVAEISKVLGLTIASRDGKPMLGIPKHARADMERQLSEAGINAEFVEASQSVSKSKQTDIENVTKAPPPAAPQERVTQEVVKDEKALQADERRDAVQDAKEKEVSPQTDAITKMAESVTKLTEAVEKLSARKPVDAAVSSVQGQKNLAHRGSRIATLKMMNEQIRKLDPSEAWHNDNIEDAVDLDALQDSISKTLVDLQRAAAPAANHAEPKANELPKTAKLADGVAKFSKSKAVTGQTETPEFLAWFKGSKVVDENGKPLVVYHGTTGADKILESGFKNGWIHLTDSKPVADSYQAWDRGGNPETLALFVKAENPAYFDAGGKKYTDISNKVYRATSDAERAGHDAMIIHNIRDNYDSSVPTEPHTTVVAFTPNQIKSATGNNGQFDSTNPDIRYSKSAQPSLGLTPAEATTQLSSLIGSRSAQALIESGRIVLVEDEAGMPAGKKTPGMTTNAVTVGGKIYVNLSKIGKDNTQGIFAHEAIHDTIVSTIGEADYARLEKRIENLRKASKNGTGEVSKFFKQAMESVPDDTKSSDVNQEVMAYAVERYTSAPRSLPESISKWTKDFIAAIRVGLMRSLPQGSKLRGKLLDSATEADLARLAIVGLRRAAKGAEASVGDGVMSDIRYSKSKPLGDLTPEQEQALKNTGGIVERKTFKQWANNAKQDLGMKITQGMVDQFAPLKKLDIKAYIQARLSKGSDGTLEAVMLFGTIELIDGVPDAKADGVGLLKVLQKLQGEQERFFWWIAANRAQGLKAQGRENLFTDKDIASLKALNQKKMPDGKDRTAAYDAVYAEFKRISTNIMDIAEQSGLIDPESRKLWERDFYIPFYRVMEEGLSGPTVKSGLVKQYAFKKLKGGTEKLNADLMANVLMNWTHLLSASAKNRAAQAALEAAVKVGAATEVQAESKGTVHFLDKGQKRFFEVNDPYLLDAITALEWTGFGGPSMKALTKFKHYLTVGVTANPAFKIRNLIRDTVSAMAQSDLSYNPVKNVAQGVKAMKGKKSQTFASMLASGGLIRFGSMLEGNRSHHVQKLINAGVDNNSILDTKEKISDVMQKAWDYYNDLGDISENANRAALYEQMLAAGKSKAEAAYAARDLLDFSMGGTWGAVRFLTQTAPFMNARMQGLYKLGRAAKADKKRFATVTGAVALASIALLLAYRDDDDWKKREDWDRDNNWWFKIGDTAYRIPKPFEVGAIGTLAERSIELMLDDEMTGKRFASRLKHMLGDTFALNPTPQLFKPLIDLYANQDSFTGRPIESMGMERLMKSDRLTGRTSEVARFLGLAGDTTNISPVQIDFMIRAYFGWLGTMATTASSYGLSPITDRPQSPEMKLRDVFLIGNFVESLPTSQSRYLAQFYDQANEIEEAYASYRRMLKEGDSEGAKGLLESKGDKIKKHGIVSQSKERMTLLNARVRMIENSRTMTKEEKRKQLDDIAVMKDRLARNATVGIQ